MVRNRSPKGSLRDLAVFATAGVLLVDAEFIAANAALFGFSRKKLVN